MILRAIYFRNWTGQVLSTYIFWLFQSGTGEFDLCPAFLSMELLNWWFHNFPQMIKIFDKTTFPNSIFKFCRCFLLLFINFICEMKNINDFAYLRLIVRKHSLEKQPPQNLFYCLFLWRCWKCPEYIAISQNTWKIVPGEIIFCNFAGFLLWIHMQILNIFAGFRWIFIQTAQVGHFLNKYTRTYFIVTFK